MKLISLTLICLKIRKLTRLFKVLRKDNPTNVIFCYLNNNSARNEFIVLQIIINGNVDIASITETKLDAS